MDVADQAQECLERAMREVMRPRPVSTRESAEVCMDCGEPIPESRRRAVPGCVRCVDCQQEHDHDR